MGSLREYIIVYEKVCVTNPNQTLKYPTRMLRNEKYTPSKQN